ncbi:MAG: T9SS type A sorting domain-containing protein [Crocinitomicaceae bacterium]|nr:T9SS type A sorting domain-containing protein [Crocinitomicaceae bacterium]
MNKLLLALSGLLFSIGVVAQTLPQRLNPENHFQVEYPNVNQVKAAGDSCGYMANAYLAINKQQSQSLFWWNGPYYGASTGATSFSEAGQYFTAPQPMRISGFQIIYYFSPAAAATSMPLVGKIYEALPDSTPGALIAVDTIDVSEQVPGVGLANYASFVFDSKPLVGGNGFFLSVRTFTSDSIYFFSNDYGQSEDLSYAFYEDVDVPANSGWVNYLLYGAAYDFDHLFFPIFKTEFTNDFTLTSDTVCRGSDACVNVINNAAITYDSLWNRYSTNDTLYLGWEFDGNNTGAEMRSHCSALVNAGTVDITMRDTINFYNDNVGKCPVQVTKQVFVVDSVNADFTFTNTGLQVDFTNTSANSDTYLWDFGDGNNNMDTNTTHTYAANGIYTVHLKAYNQCFEDSSIQSVDLSTVGLEEFGSNSVLIYPNPTQGKVIISLDEVQNDVALKVIDLLGKTVLSRKLSASLLEIDLAPFGQGTYFLRLESDSKVVTKKIVVR